MSEMTSLLNSAAIRLCAAQAVAEDVPQVYSNDTWDRLTEILSLIKRLEEQAEHEEDHPHPFFASPIYSNVDHD